MGKLVALTSASILFLFLRLEIKTNEKLREFIKKNKGLHPNWICVWRTIFCLIGIYAYHSNFNQNFGVFLFAFGSMLDAIDGLVARDCGLITEWGKSFDPLCDKIIYLIPMVIFAYCGFCSSWLVLALIITEFSGQFLVRGLLRKLKRSVAANRIGKIKATVCFTFVIYLVLLDEGSVPEFSNYLLIACILLSLGSSFVKFFQKGEKK